MTFERVPVPNLRKSKSADHIMVDRSQEEQSHEEEEEKGGAGPMQLSKLDSTDPSVIHHIFKDNDAYSPTHAFSDSNLTVIPIKLASSDSRDMGTFSFICVPKQDRGKFLPTKAKELGCQQEHFKILVEGKPVTLANGDMVYPQQVMEKQHPSQCTIMMFIPNENYLDCLLSEEKMAEFESYFSTNIDSEMQEVSIVYHVIPLKVLINERYREFMMRFGANVRHIIDCKETNEEVIAKFKSQQLT